MMLENELLALRRAMIALKAYTNEARRTINPADPKQARRFAHVQDIEAALTAGADLYDALTPQPNSVLPAISAHLNQPHLQARLSLTIEQRQALASITAHLLPRPNFPDEC